mgnify:CR=1 FL=1
MGNSCSTIHESRGEYYYRRREQYLQNNRRDLIRPQIHHELLQWTRTRRTVKYNKKMLVERDMFGYTPLHICALNNNSRDAKNFIKHMEDIEIKAYTTDRTPLHIAAFNQSSEVVEAIVKSSKANVNVVDKDLSTPFHLVFTTRRSYTAIKKITYYLITNGGNLFQKNSKNYSPLDYCINNDYYNLTGKHLENYSNGYIFLLAKNMLSQYSEFYDNGMEMIFLYNVLPYLIADKEMITFIAKECADIKIRSKQKRVSDVENKDDEHKISEDDDEEKEAEKINANEDDDDEDDKYEFKTSVNMLENDIKKLLDPYLYKQLNIIS